MAELLLAYKADANTRDNFGMMPLAYAAKTNIAKLLLANKADVNARDNNGGTPLHWAADRGSKDVAQLLLAGHADINARDKRGRTPLRIAVDRGAKAIVDLLLASNADVNAKDTNGNTPLQFGFYKQDIAALLRQHGGHGNEKTNNPLMGWYFDGHTNSFHARAILDDYQAYAQAIWPKGQTFFIYDVEFFEDGSGRHAVRIELEPQYHEFKEYYLIYDRNNMRVKVIRGKTWQYYVEVFACLSVVFIVAVFSVQRLLASRR
jgi:ankyrin repeat protein